MIDVEPLYLDVYLLGKLINNVPYYDKQKEKCKRFTPKIIKEIEQRDNNKCKLCKSISDLEVHHINPQGLPLSENGILLCDKCHTIVHIYLKLFKEHNFFEARGLGDWYNKYNALSNDLIYHLIVTADAISRLNDEVEQIKQNKPEYISRYLEMIIENQNRYIFRLEQDLKKIPRKTRMSFGLRYRNKDLDYIKHVNKMLNQKNKL